MTPRCAACPDGHSNVLICYCTGEGCPRSGKIISTTPKFPDKPPKWCPRRTYDKTKEVGK
jgi:hypothetical protein